MRRHVLPCARLFLSAFWRRVVGPAWAARPPAGERRLRGLVQEVRIRRDEAGIAHIFAENLPDLGFGAGAAMAQDRLWQMDAMRRLACGRMAELAGDRRLEGGSLHLAGPSLLAVDQYYRSLRFREIAEEELSQVSDEGRGLLEGFARGVNAWVGQCRPGDLPPEFLLAGIDPEPWRPEDSLVIGKLIGWLLSLAFVAKPILAALAADPVLQRLRPPHLADGPCIVGRGPAAEPAELDLLARRALGLLGPGTGSNSWVVGGGRTASGKPILCNDPHLVFGLPALWYPVALSAPTHRVIGATMAGIPAVLIGRNDRVAWGITAVMADDGDYYRETLDAAGTRYLRDGEWRPVETVEATFRVRGRPAPVRGTLRYVRHEGVLCPLLPTAEGEATASYRWVGFEAWRGLDGLLAMNRAGNLQEFASALEAFAVPAQNLVAADTTGAFGYYCTGKFPRRERVREATPVLDGSDPDHAWGGYLSWAEQPKALNPEDGMIVTANNRVARDLPRALTGGFWEPPYRATRIASLLGDCPKARVQDMARIQADVVSLAVGGGRGEPDSAGSAAVDGAAGAASRGPPDGLGPSDGCRQRRCGAVPSLLSRTPPAARAAAPGRARAGSLPAVSIDPTPGGPGGGYRLADGRSGMFSCRSHGHGRGVPDGRVGGGCRYAWGPTLRRGDGETCIGSRFTTCSGEVAARRCDS